MKEPITPLLALLNQVKIIHWETDDFAVHKAMDKIYNQLSNHIDNFIEAYQGNRPRIVLKEGTNISLKSGLYPKKVLTEGMDFLVNDLPTFLDQYDTDLFNIRDEMLGVLRGGLYLLSLKNSSDKD